MKELQAISLAIIAVALTSIAAVSWLEYLDDPCDEAVKAAMFAFHYGESELENSRREIQLRAQCMYAAASQSYQSP